MYYETKRALLNAVSHIGRTTSEPGSRLGMTPQQAKRFHAKNFMTDDVWQVRKLAGGSIIVELSYSYFLNAPLFGVTVFCVGNLKDDAEAWDHALSGCFRDVEEVANRLRDLNEGGRERIAALAMREA